MKLFSKRNKRDSNSDLYRPSLSQNRDSRFSYLNRQKRRNEIISSQTRIRLVSLLKFVSSSDLFLEKYILIENRKDKLHYFNNKLLDDFSESELGYRFSDSFNYYPFKFKGEFIESNDDKQTVEEVYDDFILFDLLEATILFSMASQRQEVIKRINNIFHEEKISYYIKENLITKNEGEDLRNISILLKDVKLSSKINSYYNFFDEDDYINAAKISAEILSIIFSDDSESKNTVMDKLKKDLAGSIVVNTDEKVKREEEFFVIISNISTMCHTLNNGIFDVRHSEKNRIKVSNEYLYKLICNYNISLVELLLTSLKDRYISSEDWEAIKNKYIETYKINKNTFYYIPDPNVKDEDINPEDIPF
ncbi:hypothetical protein IT403_02185 [Candidatus Nomurabacteria bacterium]|nr:hypothetical protein [Candidatus Nomurabacteria bacterium]